jgi:hypothetical protein
VVAKLADCHSTAVELDNSVQYLKAHVNPYAGYRQFYVSSDSSTGDTGTDTFWTEDASRDRLAVGPYTVAVSTDTYGRVPVDIEILDGPSTLPLDGWDHVVEASIDVSSGRLEVSGCPDPEPLYTIEVEPGGYIVRVFSRGLSPDADDGGIYNGDEYLIQFWRGPARERTVMKRFA